MKKLICILVAIVILSGLTACQVGSTAAPGKQPEETPGQSQPENTDISTEPGAPEMPEFTGLEVYWADQVLEDYPDYIRIDPPNYGPDDALVAFIGNDIYDFELLSVTVEFDEYGNTNYQMEPVCEHGGLQWDMPVVIPLKFPGDLPCWAVRFTDGYGMSFQYLLSISGEDYSLILEEIPLG